MVRDLDIPAIGIRCCCGRPITLTLVHALIRTLPGTLNGTVTCTLTRQTESRALTRTRTFTLNVVLTLTPPLTLTFPVTLVPTFTLTLGLTPCLLWLRITYSFSLSLSLELFCFLCLVLISPSLSPCLSLSLFPLFLTLLLPPREAKVPRKNPNVYEALNWRRLFRTDYWGLDMFEAGLSCTGRSFFESDSSFSAVFVCGMIALVRTRGRRLRIRQLGRVLGPISPSDL